MIATMLTKQLVFKIFWVLYIHKVDRSLKKKLDVLPKKQMKNIKKN